MNIETKQVSKGMMYDLIKLTLEDIRNNIIERGRFLYCRTIGSQHYEKIIRVIKK